MTEKNLLEIRDLQICFRGASGELSAVSGVGLSIQPGEIVGLVGESGCGKTVTSLSIMGLLPDRGDVSGEIVFNGDNLLSKTHKDMRNIRGNTVSMIFQEPMTALNPVMTIGRQLCEPLMLHKNASREEAWKRAVEALELVQVPQAETRMKSYPHQLSGGLCQRVMIAMALICEPQLLIADEPTTALDVTIQAQILSLLRDLRRKLDTSILMITHDLGVVAELCDRVYVMYAGHVMEQAEVFELFDNPAHPYTSGLLRSLPRLDTGKNGEADELYSIPGMVPNLRDLPKGCPFEPRCGVSFDRCREALPPLYKIRKGHAARCWHCAEGGLRHA